MENNSISCPKCGKDLLFILITQNEKGEWDSTYGCPKRCIEATKINFGEKPGAERIEYDE